MPANEVENTPVIGTDSAVRERKGALCVPQRVELRLSAAFSVQETDAAESDHRPLNVLMNRKGNPMAAWRNLYGRVYMAVAPSVDVQLSLYYLDCVHHTITLSWLRSVGLRIVVSECTARFTVLRAAVAG
jgi:hypothetical protein